MTSDELQREIDERNAITLAALRRMNALAKRALHIIADLKTLENLKIDWLRITKHQ